MKTSKFYVLFLSLQNKDKKRFLDFLLSPFHNHSPRLVKLGEYFVKHTKVIKEDAYAYVYGAKKKYSDVLMRRLMNGLLVELKKFISITQFLDDKIEFNTFLLKGINEMNQEKMQNEVLLKQTKLIVGI